MKVIRKAGARRKEPAVRDDAAQAAHRRARAVAPVARRVRRRAITGYSRFVSTMKFVLPTVAILLIVLVAAWPQFKPQDSRIRIGFGTVNAREAMDPGMLNPRYVGIDEGNLPFSITADLAKNVTKNAGSVELEMPKADLTLSDGTWLVLTAENGVYQRDSKDLALNGAVNLFHDSGYEIRTEKAKIDLGLGEASGNVPVVGHGPFGELRSQGFHLKDKGATVVFTGKAKLVIFPGFGAESQ